MKETFYFSHDSNARSDEKILPLRRKHGSRGYGIYFMILEMLREANAYQMLNDCSTIAYELKEDDEIVKDVIENFKLFKFTNDGFFYSESLKERMIKREEIRILRAEAGRKGGLAKAKQNYSKCLALKERKGKKRKGKKRDNNNEKNFIKPNKEELKDYFLEKLKDKRFIDLFDPEVETEKFLNHFESNGWKVGGKTKMKSWQCAVNTWCLRIKEKQKPKPNNPYL